MSKDLEDLLFKKQQHKQPLETMQNIDITITSYSDISDGPPRQKLYTQQAQNPKKKIRAIQTQEDPQQSNSNIESMTPKRMNKLINWSRYHVTPGDGKNIFPQVQGPSLELSGENSLQIKQPQEIEQQILVQNQKNSQQLKTINSNSQIQPILDSETKKYIENLEKQMATLTERLNREMEQRKIDENILSEIKLKEIRRSSVFEVNQRCQNCLQSKTELSNILEECSIEDEDHLFQNNLTLPILIREVVTLLLTKQREQIDIAFQQYETQSAELSEKLEEQILEKEQILKENSNFDQKLQSIIQQNEEREKIMLQEFEKLKEINMQLISENGQLKSQLIKQTTDENLNHFRSIESERQSNPDISQIKQQFQTQLKDMLNKLNDQEKQIASLNNKTFGNDENKLPLEPKSLREKDKKNIELFQQNKQLLSVQKEQELCINDLKDELEKIKKKLILKQNEAKQYVDQNKLQSEKITELNGKILQLQQQLISAEAEIQINNIHPTPRVISQYLQPNQEQFTQLIEGYQQYQQEFLDLKQMFTDKMRQYESLQNKIQQLQQDNNQLNQQNQKLTLENSQIKDSKKIEDFTTGIRCSAASGDSINVKSFIHHSQDQLKRCNVFDLIQPELMSVDETLQILKEILDRSVRSVELIKKICQFNEVRELLQIIQSVDEKYGNNNSKLTKIINGVLAEKKKIKMTNRSEKVDFYNS